MIVLEAIDGAGKTTIAKMLSKNLKLEMFSYPDRKSIYWKILNKFLNKQLELSTYEQFFLYLSDIIKDKEKWGRHTLLDRYVTSTIAYQSATGFPMDLALSITKRLFDQADLIIFIDVDPSVSLSRKEKRDRFEQEEFLRKVRENYYYLYKRKAFGKWVIVDGERNLEEVYKDVEALVKKALK